MRKFYCFILGFFLLTVQAEKESFQGYHTKPTKGTTVTKDLLLEKKNTIGHGTEAIPTENTHQHTAVAAKFPEVVLFNTRTTSSNERTQIAKASAITGSTGGFVSRNGQNSLTSTKDTPSAMRIHTESETLLISNYNNIVSSSTQATFVSMMNGTSEPEVHLSSDAVKAYLWLHTLHDNRNQRNTDSNTLTSADRGPGVPILSASHPCVIDNLAVLRNDNDDKQSQGNDDKGISNLGRNENPFGIMESIFRSDTAEDSVRGNILTNLCLTCQKDGRAVSTEKSVALAALSPDGSSDSLSIEGLTLDSRQFTTSLPSFHQQSVGEQEETLNKDITQENITKYSSFGVREQPIYNVTYTLLSLNKTENHSQSILNNSQIKSSLSDTGTVAFDTRSLAEMSPATQKDTKKQSGQTYPIETLVTERPISTTSALYSSSLSLYTVRKQETLGREVSIGGPQSKLIYFSKHNKNASHSPSTNFKNVFDQNQPLDFSSGSVSSLSDVAEAQHSSQKSILAEGNDHSTGSHPIARMRSIEAHSAISSFSLSRPTSSVVRNPPESHSLTGRAHPLISALKSQTPAKPRTKEPTLTLLLKNSAIKFTSIATKGHPTDEQSSQSFNTVNSIVKHYVVDPAGPENKPQTPIFFLSESRRDFDDMSTLTLTTLPSKSFSERLTMSRLLGSQSKITQERMFDVSNDNHVTPTQQSFVKYNRDLIRDSLTVRNLKLGDQNKQVLTVVAEDEDQEIIKTDGKLGEEIKETHEILKLQEEEESRDEKKLGNKKELFRPDKISGKQEKIMNTGVEIKQNTDREEDKKEEHGAKTSIEEGRGTIREEDVTLRQNKDPRQGEVRDEEGAETKGVTKMNTKNSTLNVVEKQREPFTTAGAGREETASKEDFREIGREDMTNVPLGPTANSKELNRDKVHTDPNLSSRHCLMKPLGALEHNEIHLGENIAQIVEMKNKPFSYKVTSHYGALHSTLRSQSPKLSRMTSFPKEPYTQIKPHPPSSLTKESTQNKVVKATFSVTAIPKRAPKLSQAFGVSTSEFIDALKLTISHHSSATKSAHPVLKSMSNMLKQPTTPLAITAELPRAQSHSTVKSSSVSIIHSISDQRHAFSTMVSKENSLLKTTNEREQAEHVIPARKFDSSVKDLLTSNMIEEVNTSSVNPAPTEIYNDSSTRPPRALSSVAHTSVGQPHQRQSAPQISQSASSSFDMTSGQPFSFKLLEQTAHSDALHAPVDDNEQRSVQTLMASMSPEAKNDQFSLSSMSLLPNPMLFGDDSLPGTYSLTGLTRSASEKEILRASAEYANSGSGQGDSLLVTADETNQTEENHSLQKITVTSGAELSHVPTKKMAEIRDEKSTSSFIAQTIDRRKHHAGHTEEFNSSSILQTEKVAVKNTNEDSHNDRFNVDSSDDANNTVKTTLGNNHLSQLGGYNETRAQTIMHASKTTHKNEQAINEDFVPVTKDFAVPVLDTNDRTGTTTFAESDSLPKIPQIQAKDLTSNAISEMELHAAKKTEKQHDPSTPRGTVADIAPLVPHIHFASDLKISTPQIAEQIVNVTSEFQITTTETNHFVSPAPTASAGSLIVSTEAHESVLTSGDSVKVVIEKSSQAAHAERMVQSNSHIEPSSLREPPTTATTGKLTPAVKGRSTTETQSVEQSEREISVQVIEQNQHAQSGMIAATHPINDPGEGVQPGLIKAAHRAGDAHDTTSTMVKRDGYLSFKDIKTTLTTESAFEGKHPLHETTPTLHTLDRADQHKKQALPEKTSINQVLLGVVTNSLPPMGISPTEIIKKTSCRTVGCEKSGETTEATIGAGEIDHTAPEKMYKTQAGNTGGDHFNAVHSPDTKSENGNCSTDLGKATPQVINLDFAPATSKSDHDHATAAKSMTDETSTSTWRVLVETDHLQRREELEQAEFVEKNTQRHFHKQTSKAQEAVATEVTSSEPEATTAQTAAKTTERTLLTDKTIKTQLNRGAAKAEIFEAQNATRATRAAAKEEPEVQESGRRLLMPEPESESELPRLKYRRRTSNHLHLSGVSEVSDDLCGSGNYTAEISLGTGIKPGDAVPALGNLRVVINLKTNNTQINLEVTSCCLSPTFQPDLTNSTCCLFSRLAAEPAGITLMPSALSTSASFTISLFQMINYSVVYLHCDLSVCLRNRSDCERQCPQQRSAFPLEGPEAVVTNLRNRISFGPMLKEVKNSTFPEDIDPSELDLVLVIVSLVVGSSLVTVTLLLVWLAYRRRAIWLLHSPAPTRACCSCLQPGGDLILP